MLYLQSLTREDLAELILPLSRPKKSRQKRRSESDPEALERMKLKQAEYRAKQIFVWVYQRFVTDWDEMTDLSLELREWLKENVEIFRLTERQVRQSQDGTRKTLWDLSDRKTIESVIIPAALSEKGKEAYAGASLDKDVLDNQAWKELAPRLTACISSQVGCAMGCKFCLTGIQGLDRHLETHEIVTQVYELKRQAPLTNIVFMGMGEPLHNLDSVSKACQILIDPCGMDFSKRKVTVSTSGLVPAIDELGKRVDVSLAISLNATTDEQRDQIMPVNRRFKINDLLGACRRYPVGSHRQITFEYVLLKDFNDSLEDAERLIRLIRGIKGKVNLIPFNEHSGSEFKRPDDQTVRAFHRYLLDRGVTAMVRISKGRDILAACGQLRSIFGTSRGSERHPEWKELPVMPSS